MRKNILIIISAILVCVTFLSACTDKNEAEIDKFNENFNGKFKLAEKMPSVSELDFEGFLFEQGMGGYSLNSVNDLTQYDVGGYPDCLDDAHIIRFRTEDSRYTVFGFSVGDTRTKAESALADNGYTQVEDELPNGTKMKLGKIIVWLWGSDLVAGISVSIEVTNKQGVVF